LYFSEQVYYTCMGSFVQSHQRLRCRQPMLAV
jgi:hypothetical protein